MAHCGHGFWLRGRHGAVAITADDRRQRCQWCLRPETCWWATAGSGPGKGMGGCCVGAGEGAGTGMPTFGAGSFGNVKPDESSICLL